MTSSSTRRVRVARLVAAGLCLPWLAWAIVRVFGLDRGYPLVSIIAFTPYAALTSVVPVAVSLLLRRWWIAGFALVVALVLLGVMLPRALPSDPPPRTREGQTITVMSLNMRLGGADPRAVMRLVRSERVDVLSLQEVDSALPGLDRAGARRLLPERVLAPRANSNGSALLARRRLSLRPQSDPAGRAQASALLILPGGRRVAIEAVHPKAPTSEAKTTAWRQALAALPSSGPGVAMRVLAGDFNATLDHDQLRDLLDRGYADAADETGSGLRTTWPVGRRRPPLTIDHVLVDRRIAVRSFEAREVPGTDHRAVIAELALPRR